MPYRQRKRLAVSEMTTRLWTFGEDVNAYRRAGIDAIGVWREKIEAYGVEKGVALLDQVGLPVASLMYAGFFVRPTTLDSEERVDDARKAVELASQLRASYLGIISGPQGQHSREEARSMVIRSLQRLALVAEPRRVALALMPMHARKADTWSFVNSVAEALDIVVAVGSRNLGLLLDVAEVWEEQDLFAQIDRAATRIYGVRLGSWPHPGTPSSPGTVYGPQALTLRNILRAIDATGYEGFYEVEVISEELWGMDTPATRHLMLRQIRDSFRDLWREVTP